MAGPTSVYLGRPPHTPPSLSYQAQRWHTWYKQMVERCCVWPPADLVGEENSLCQVLVFFSCQTKPFSQKRCLSLLVLERYLTNSSENGLFKRGSPHAWIIHKLCQSSMDSDMELLTPWRQKTSLDQYNKPRLIDFRIYLHTKPNDRIQGKHLFR